MIRIFHQRITIIKTRKPMEHNINDELQCLISGIKISLASGYLLNY